MPEWQERITHETPPAIRIEHEARYRAAAPLVRGAATWLDLGCGAGVAAAAVFGDQGPQKAVLVDASADALAQAVREVPAQERVPVQADLSTSEGLDAVRAALADARDGVATCFEVIEHLESFVGAVELLVELAQERDFTVVLSVPNDAFWPIESPWHKTMWGEGSFEELRRLLPAEHVIARQVPLEGSAIVPEGADPASPPPLAARADAVPSHYLAAFGPRAPRTRLEQRRRDGRPLRAAPVGAPARGQPRDLRGPHRVGRPAARGTAEVVALRVAFVVNGLELSGGVGVVVEHARRLATHGIRAELVLARAQHEPDWGFAGLADLPVHGMPVARGIDYDLVVATWWETVEPALELPARRHAYFIQSLEDRFYRPGESTRLAAALTHDLPLPVITEARWIAETLESLAPERRCLLVRNGIAKDVFASPDVPPTRRDGPLRILIEGNSSWFKGVPEALAAANAMREPRHVTLVSPQEQEGADVRLGPLSQRELATAYADADVVLKLSRVEGMFGPPLEGFHMGATCVVTAVTGHEEYVEHGENGLVVEWDDVRGTSRALDLLARDRLLLHRLRWGALATARSWPSWDQQATVMAAALREIARRPVPSGGFDARLVAELRGGIEAHALVVAERDQLRRRVAPIDRALTTPGVRTLARPARRVWRRIRR